MLWAVRRRPHLRVIPAEAGILFVSLEADMMDRVNPAKAGIHRLGYRQRLPAPHADFSVGHGSLEHSSSR